MTIPDPSKHIIKNCKWCGSEFVSWTYRKQEYCNKFCKSKYAAHQPKPSLRKPESFIERTCKKCGKSFKIHKCQIGRYKMYQGTYCSNECRYSDKSSDIENKCKSILEDIGVNFEYQKFIKPFYVDFLIEGKFALHVDGEYWHGHPRFTPFNKRQIKQMKRDKEENEYLISLGYKVIRIWERDININHISNLLAHLPN